MTVLYIVTAAALLLSLVKDRKKTVQAVKRGMKKLEKILPSFLMVLIVVSISLYFISDDTIAQYLGSESQVQSVFLASFAGSLMMMPSPVVYPLCELLLEKGVSYTVLAAFSTTLMMVGATTLPMEIKLFGKKLAIMRNAVSFASALLVAFGISFFEGWLK
ncbi:MAG: permease [Fibrobacterota bacterium]